MKICFFAIGGELLKGRVVNTNLTRTGLMLREHGYSITREVIVSDEKEAIIDALRAELENNDIVLMSGGLGPTKDDVTKSAIATFFGVGMKEDTETMRRLKTYFEFRKILFTPKNQEQAMVPANCEVMPNPKGTAPGMCFRLEGKLLFSMPGVPFEMLYLLEYEVLPIIKAAFPPFYIKNHILRIWGKPESFIADEIEKTESLFPPQLDISYLPRTDGVWIECTLKGKPEDSEQINVGLDRVVSAIRTGLGNYVYTEGKQSLQEEVHALFTQSELTLAIAESMTGGNICGKLITISGTSTYLKGGVVVYFTEMKTQLLQVPAALIAEKGVVSSEVSAVMAENIRKITGVSVGLSITGYAEKLDAQTPAHAWIGYSDSNGTSTRYESFVNDREINIERATAAAMIYLLRNSRKLIGLL